ncbi:MAG: 50S ribosomal protein L21 [Atribacterota bacterium]
MFAIIEANGKQYPVEEGKLLALDSWVGQRGDEVIFEQVLLLRDGGKILVGKPYVKGSKVQGTVVQLKRGRKTLVFKYKPKVNYRRKIGHRQAISLVKIEKIEVEE